MNSFVLLIIVVERLSGLEISLRGCPILNNFTLPKLLTSPLLYSCNSLVVKALRVFPQFKVFYLDKLVFYPRLIVEYPPWSNLSIVSPFCNLAKAPYCQWMGEISETVPSSLLCLACKPRWHNSSLSFKIFQKSSKSFAEQAASTKLIVTTNLLIYIFLYSSEYTLYFIKYLRLYSLNLPYCLIRLGCWLTIITGFSLSAWPIYYFFFYFRSFHVLIFIIRCSSNSFRFVPAIYAIFSTFSRK